MAFKLGKSNSPIIQNGEIKSKLFLNKEDTSIPGTPILRKDLDKGILGEANNDGSIFISHKVQPGSEQEKHVLMHEMVHLTDMKVGKLAYDDNHIKWNGEIYPRENGKIFFNCSVKGFSFFIWSIMYSKSDCFIIRLNSGNSSAKVEYEDLLFEF